MTIDLFTLCEFASNNAGSLTIVNTLDRISADHLPWRAYIAFAIKGALPAGSQSETKLKLKIFQQENKSIIFETEIAIPPTVGSFVAAGNLRGLIINEAGKYVFQLSDQCGFDRDYIFNVETADSTH